MEVRVKDRVEGKAGNDGNTPNNAIEAREECEKRELHVRLATKTRRVPLLPNSPPSARANAATAHDPTSSEHESSVCEACLLGKATVLPFPKHVTSRASRVLELVHSDVCGPMRVATPQGKHYFVTFIDDYSRYCVVYLLRLKSDVSKVLREFYDYYTRQTGLPLRALRSDNGGEYRDGETRAWLRANGVALQYSAPHSQSQNGVAERKNRVLAEGGRTMMIRANMPTNTWGEAVCYKNYVSNCSFSRAAPAGKTAYEAFFSHKPNVSMARVWGCAAYVHVPDTLRHKLQAKAVKCVHVGISDEHKAWRLMDVSTGRLIISKDVIFDETSFPKCKEAKRAQIEYAELFESGDVISLGRVHDNYTAPVVGDVPHIPPTDANQLHRSQSDDNDDNDAGEFVGLGDDLSDVSEGEEEDDGKQQVRRSTRDRAPSEKLINHAQVMRVKVEDMIDSGRACGDPASYREATQRWDAPRWLEAIRAETESLMSKGTFEFVSAADVPKGRGKTVSAKWVLTIKRKSDGTIERYKARLVARGFTQRYGVNFRETFAPVVRLNSLRALLAVACRDDLNLTHIDIETAFLYGDLPEEIYLRLPEGLEGGAGEVVRLRKGLYGLKQASRQWYQALDAVLLGMGFVKSRGDPCIYVCVRDGKRVMMAVYVDDFVIADNDAGLREWLKQGLQAHFKLKDLGELQWCLGLRVTRDRAKRTLTLDQHGYIEELLEDFGMSDCKPCSTPEQVNHHLPKHERDGNDNAQYPYREAVGKLMYAMVCSRPDIASAVRAVSKHLCGYGEQHWVAVKRIMRYLKGTSDMKLTFGGARVDERLVGYADADWGNDKDGRKSVTGYVFTFAGGPVSWCSRNQRTVALSSCEAEYMSLTEACRETTYLRLLLSELGHMQRGATTIYEDNQGAIALAKNPEHHSRNKHIDMRHHFCRDMVESGAVEVVYMPTGEMPADALTKGLATEAFRACCRVIMNF